MKYIKQHTLDDESNDSFKKQHSVSLFQGSNPWQCLKTNLKEADCVLMSMEPIFRINSDNCNVNVIYRESSTYDVDPFFRRGVTRISM